MLMADTLVDSNTLTPLLLFKSLSDITRLSCVILIMQEKSLCVCELEAALLEDQPKVSRHLALLRKDGILDTERKGKWVYYHINPQLATWVGDIITAAKAHHADLLDTLSANLKKMADRPNSCC